MFRVDGPSAPQPDDRARPTETPDPTRSTDAPASPDDPAADRQTVVERARRGVRAWVREAGHRTGTGLRIATPYGILAFLAASAVAPVAGAGLGASGAFESALGQLGGMGTNYLADVLVGAADRMRGRGGEPLSEQQWRDSVAEALLPVLEAGDERSRALRADIGALLHEIDAVGAALAASTQSDERTRAVLADAFQALGSDVGELRWMVADARRALDRLQREFATQSVRQHQQMDLVRQHLVTVTQLHARLTAHPDRLGIGAAIPASGTAGGSERPPDGGTVSGPDEATGNETGGTLADEPTGGDRAAVCPYPGLASFQPEDAAVFRGREEQVAELLGRLAEQLVGGPPVVVTGVSGVGKSSLLRAGLLPAIAGGGLGERAGSWPWLLLAPSTSPLAELVERTAALAGAYSATEQDTFPPQSTGTTVEPRPVTAPVATAEPATTAKPAPTAEPNTTAEPATTAEPNTTAKPSTTAEPGTAAGWLRVIRAHPERFGELAARAGRATRQEDDAGHAGHDGGRLVIVVDQFEELFTQCDDPGERLAFATALANAAPALVVIGLRADFYAACTELPPLAGMLAAGHVVLGPLGVDQLRRAVREPAGLSALEIEPGLVELLLTDLGALSGPGYDPGTLPLLGHALRATWARREGSRLTVNGYRATGGIRHAVAETAERIYLGLDRNGRAALRSTLLGLVSIAETGTPVRRRADRQAVDTGVLARLVRARLVTAGEDTVEISHEALLTNWPRLAGWLVEAREEILLRQRITEAARDWAASGEDPDLLLRGARLAAAREWAARTGTAVHGGTGTDGDGNTTRPGDTGAPRDTGAPGDTGNGSAAGHGGSGEHPGGPAGRVAVPDPQARYLAASVAAAEAEELARRRNTLRLRRLATGLAAALLLAVAGGLVALDRQADAQDRRAEAEQRGREALSRQYAAESLSAGRFDEATAVGKALDAWAEAPTAEARGALLSAQMATFAGHLGREPGGVTAAASPDGSIIATGQADGRIRLWDSGKLRERQPALEHPGKAAVVWLDFSPDGRYLASSAVGNTGVRIWEMPSGKPLRTLPGFGAVAWLPGTRTVLASRSEGVEDGQRIGLWDATSGRLVRSLSTGTVFGFDMSVSVDGRYVAMAGPQREAGIWRLRDGRRVSTLKGVLYLAFAPDGTLVTSDETGRLRQVAVPAGRLLRNLVRGGRSVENATGVPSPVAVTPDGNVLAPTDQPYEAGLYPLFSDARHTLRGNRTAITDVAASRDGRVLVVTGVTSPTTVFRRPAHWLSHPQSVVDVAFEPGGERLATVTQDDVLRIWDQRQRTLVASFPLGSPAQELAYSPDGLLAVALGGGTVQLRKGDGSLRASLRTAGTPIEVAFSPDGSLLAAATGQTTAEALTGTPARHGVTAWKMSDLSVLGTQSTGTAALNGLAFTPDGATLVTATSDAKVSGLQATATSSIRRWRVAGMAPLQSWPLPGFRALDVAVSPDGRTLAVGGTNNQVELRSMVDGKVTASGFAPHPAPIRYLAFSPDGHTLATATNDDYPARLWDVDQRRPTATLSGHIEALNGLAFSADGSLLATASADGSTRLWRLDPQDVARQLCRITVPINETNRRPAPAACR